jgi:hypothetical protein
MVVETGFFRTDAVAGVAQKANGLLAQVDAHRDLSISLSHDTTR